MTVETALQKLNSIEEKLSALNHAIGLINYDGVTTAPTGTADNRGHSLAVLSEASYSLSTGAETSEILDYLDANRDALPPKDARRVWLLRRDLVRLRRIPAEEYVAYQRLTCDADDVWRRAKQNNDFQSFRPYLERIVETCIRFAGYIDPDKAPYDVWLDTFEDGLSMERCELFFSTLRARLTPLIRSVMQAKQLPDDILHGHFPVAMQEKLSDRVMELMDVDRTHCGISTTEHPFTTDFSKYDVRITTHYHEEDFSSSLYSVIHEAGHALYELHTSDEYAYTILGTGVSMGIHESQSRFYENIIGRSREFTSLLLPVLRELDPESFRDCTVDELYHAVNRAEPSLIRTEADELTYAMHIMIRYEIEKRLMSGEVKVSELPELWSNMYREYLGIDVPSDKEGVLQDSHWSGGMIGYFPSYALGSAYGAQLLRAMERDIDVFGCVAQGRLSVINSWLEEKIWRHGAMYNPGELLENALGEPFDPGCFLDYLEEKYSRLYDL